MYMVQCGTAWSSCATGACGSTRAFSLASPGATSRSANSAGRTSNRCSVCCPTTCSTRRSTCSTGSGLWVSESFPVQNGGEGEVLLVLLVCVVLVDSESEPMHSARCAGANPDA